MSNVEIQPIELPRDAMKFVKAWWPIYKDDPAWVPPLLMERKDFFNPKKNRYFQKADVQLFVAILRGKVVGTISAHIDKANQEHEPGVGYFGFFEFPNDVEIARALIDAAANWLREHGMKEARGPFNFTSNHEFGLRVDNFDQSPPAMNPHNSAYYEGIYQEIGLYPVKNWYAYWFERKEVPERFAKAAARVKKRNDKLTYRRLDMKNWDDEVKAAFEIYEDAWADNWGHADITLEEFRAMAGDLKMIMDPNLVWFAFLGDEPIGLTIAFPDVNQVAKKMNGRLFPFGWYHFVFGRKKVDAIRIFILGVKRKYHRLPIAIPLYVHLWESCLEYPNVRGADASLILEENYRMREPIEKLGAKAYMTYRTYAMNLEDPTKPPEGALNLDGEPAADPSESSES